MKPTVPRKRRRRPTLSSVVRQTTKAGLAVARVEVDPASGRISVVIGKPVDVIVRDDPASSIDRSEWN